MTEGNSNILHAFDQKRENAVREFALVFPYGFMFVSRCLTFCVFHSVAHSTANLHTTLFTLVSALSAHSVLRVVYYFAFGCFLCTGDVVRLAGLIYG